MVDNTILDNSNDSTSDSSEMVAPSVDNKIYHSTSFRNMLAIIDEGGLNFIE